MKGKEVGVWMDEREPSARVSRQRRGLTKKAPAFAEAPKRAADGGSREPAAERKDTRHGHER